MRKNIGHLQQAAALVAIAAAACAQAPEPATRALWDSTFLRNRPAQKKVSRVPQAVASGATDDAFVGLTVWRLRPSRPADELGVPGVADRLDIDVQERRTDRQRGGRHPEHSRYQP